MKYIKDNIISIYLTEDQDKPYCFYFKIEEPFKKVATYKIKNPNYKEEIEEKIEEDEDETVIELEWLWLLMIIVINNNVVFDYWFIKPQQKERL